ncbi:unnamed protein product [Prorocentrum cordatum]|uniref:Uncharacterized protein n=1 Tax=Prorocentrum cordatum TaxID=2364126 RepID=A0ABN9VND1_9DINO|nr:unnamed protein product [Polarella glacialis]
MALAALAQPLKPAQNKQQANLHTMEITVDNVVLDGPDGEEYRAFRAVVADGNSAAAGAPAKFHGLNAFTPRAMEQFSLPPVPAKHSVLEATSGMLPPDTSKNPCQHISWVWMLVGYSTKKMNAKTAADHVVKKLLAIIKEGMIECDITVPPVQGKGGWTSKTAIDGTRLEMVRSGTKLDGGSCEISEHFNFSFRLATDLNPAIRSTLKSFANKYQKLFTITDVCPTSAFPNMHITTSASANRAKPMPSAKGKAKAKAKAKAKSKAVAKTALKPKRK